MKNPRFLLYLTFLFSGLEAEEVYCQTRNKPGTGLSISRAKGEIVLDGALEEEDWKQTGVAKDFFLNYPVDSLPPSFQTEARLLYNDHFFYASFVCYDDDRPDVVQSLRRDIEFMLNDNVGLYLDPYNDFTNGFYFTITPQGVQSEGIMSGGGSGGDDAYNNNWDNKWYSSVRKYHDRWIAELAIPLKSFRYNHNIDEWNITFVRKDLKRNQTSSWIATPIQFIPASFAYAGKLHWTERPPAAGMNISVIPYAIASSSQDKENEKPVENSVNAGFDAKVGLTPSLNLDLTVNPDFSNVEVDRQVINLTRFEFQFPERRQFFLENSDLFSTPGFTTFTQPFFSRRIGLEQDSSGNLARVPIMYGARISGKLGPNWRIGIMNLQTKKKESLGLPDQNYTVGVIQRQIFSRSNIGVVFVNKQSLGIQEYDSTQYYHDNLLKKYWTGSDSITKLNLYNRVLGADFNLITKNNRWGGQIYYHKSFDNFSEGDNYSHGAFISYTTRNINAMGGYVSLGRNYNAEVGFVPSMAVYPGNYGGFSNFNYNFYPKKAASWVVMSPGVGIDYTSIPDGTLTDRTLSLTYSAEFRSTANLKFTAKRIYQKLPEDFDILYPEGDSVLLAGQEFNWTEANIRYFSDTRKVFNYSVNSTLGQFYNGTRMGIGGMVAYRFQPYGSISVTFDYNEVKLPEEYGSARFILVSPRLDFTFTDKLFLTTFVQYNDRYDNVNLNARLQWRYKPASDFFIVYTENYFSDTLRTKNRALVLKFNYWFNL